MEFEKYAITQLMGQEHKKLFDILADTEQSFNDILFERRKFDNFIEEVEKHFQLEEKMIFEDAMNKNKQIDEGLKILLDEHKQIREFIIKLKQKTDQQIPHNFDELKVALLNHNNFENSNFYPRLDKNLSDDEKTTIIEKLGHATT
jgi:hypothetical protein